MDLYSFLRQLADSWVMLLMLLFFFGVVLWAFRPGSRRDQDDAANSIFRNEKRPAPADEREAEHGR
ncbi:MAG: cbb3-type cytochrome c oxidase subunit 3 [Paracoccus sp. (in: a-proteobacteria)]|uniref:cbb3-type cytochrome c oxidase subunit 3 n=1 Tax=Paracoccus sp. TaxID=267 RepID=UPI0026E0BDAB|nr:cbb3-type cytochrome c oxidase subunit 3 [Paracoccus sp. (in: a-proteobacteria)]MDO5620584.1 cbb3-type cytochrome c oxidase subunit 3 [Paracoccus sp. (in: a-proteobacteria)]